MKTRLIEQLKNEHLIESTLRELCLKFNCTPDTLKKYAELAHIELPIKARVKETCKRCGVIKTDENSYKVHLPSGNMSYTSYCRVCHSTASRSTCKLCGNKLPKGSRVYCSDLCKSIGQTEKCYRKCLNQYCNNKISKKSKSGLCRTCRNIEKAKTVVPKQPQYVYICKNCHKVIPDNRAKRTDFCGVCLPQLSCKVGYCFHCGKVIPAKQKACGGCRPLLDKITEAKGGKRSRKKISDFKRSLKESGCVICGYKKCMNALHFHHLGQKGGAISRFKTLGQVSREVENGRLVVLCANCHSELHAGMIDVNQLQKYVITNGEKQFNFLIGWH